MFARHGFAGASLRQVTAAAQVNLAAVNYHFGSKENLVNEVFRRRLDVLNAERLAALAAARAKPDYTLEDTLDAFVRPALALTGDENGGAPFVRVLARAYAEHNERLRKFLHDNYGHILKEFATDFARFLPHLDKQELYWRLDIVSGALTYAMADFGLIKRRTAAPRSGGRAPDPVCGCRAEGRGLRWSAPRKRAELHRARHAAVKEGCRWVNAPGCFQAKFDNNQDFHLCLLPPCASAKPLSSVPASWAPRSRHT